MNALGLGVDIVEIARFAAAVERQGQALLDRCFLATEQAYCTARKDSARYYAARFAAKEAVSKALGTGIGEHIGWLDMEICRKASGAPFVVLHGIGAQTASRLGVREVLLSISHSEHYAVANAIAVGTAQTV